jgi:hypothetical protein
VACDARQQADSALAGKQRNALAAKAMTRGASGIHAPHGVGVEADAARHVRLHRVRQRLLLLLRAQESQRGVLSATRECALFVAKRHIRARARTHPLGRHGGARHPLAAALLDGVAAGAVVVVVVAIQLLV